MCRSILHVFIDIVHCLRQTCYIRISLWTMYGRVVEVGFNSSCFFLGLSLFKTNVPLSRELSSGHPNVSLFHLEVYLIILYNLIVPTLLSLVGGPLSGTECGSPNHILYMLFLYYLLLY
jgi:hypothetical protein